jgi:eukaryotic-like serine/threonine-protein kinase
VGDPLTMVAGGQDRPNRRPAPTDPGTNDAFLPEGSRLAGYRIEERLGIGGMAVVYRALDERLGRQVALKLLAPALARDQEFRMRFIRESRAAAAVDHPNIIPVFEAGEVGDVLFIAMRYVRGGDVRELIERHRTLDPQRAMELITPVAAALDAAHAAGLVHRDVKPANMLLDSRADHSHVYLTDFGITTQLADTGEMTGTGVVVGTGNYMAPEQVQGRPVDGRTDQYALACSAFEMLTGTPPFSDSGGISVMMAQVRDAPPPPTARRPELPAAVDGVFAAALAKAPVDRFATCGEFAAALGAAMGRPRAGWPGPAAGPARAIILALKESFRYIHEPALTGEDALPSLGNDALMADLERRIRHSRGGTFLVTGFRGVGKSTLVLRALDDVVARSGPGEVVLPVSLSVARATSTERLLFAIVRRVFETLSDLNTLERLPPQTRHALLVAYMRTSLAFKETQSEARERSAGLELGLGPGRALKAVADIAVPKASISAKRSHSMATEAAFLAYSETDVEYDLMRIVSLVDRQPDAVPRSWRRRLTPWRPKPVPLRLHLVIVLDEVDKLTADEKGLAAVEDLLSGIKNVLTMPGVHFLIVAGPDLHDRAIRDSARGNGVYESVFGWRLYVPCIWDAPERLLADIVHPDAVADDSVLQVLANYLRFKARGMPRRLLQEVHAFVNWEGDQALLRIGAREMERVEFYARLEGILRNYAESSGRRRLFPVAIDEDRWRLSGYYVVDWVLQSEGEPFSAADLLHEGDEAEFDPLLRVSRRNVDSLLDHLAEHRILEVVREVTATATVYGGIAGSNDKVFQLAEDIRSQLYGFAARHESERAVHEISLAPARPAGGPAAAASPPPDGPPTYMETGVGTFPRAGSAAAAAPGQAAPLAESRPPGGSGLPDSSRPPAVSGLSDTGVAGSPVLGADPGRGEFPPIPPEQQPPVVVRPPARIIGNQYELEKLIGQGGLSSVYKARDLVTGQQVVVKMLRPALGSAPDAIARIRREAEVTKGLTHRQIARLITVTEGPDGNPALVLEWVSGPNLGELIRNDGPMPPKEVAAIGRVLAAALAYLADRNIVRLDLKPGNIIMTADRGPVLTDLGIALRAGPDTSSLTMTGQIVGTPAFMPPEQIEGQRPDARGDIYALGLVLYFCLAGRGPWEDLPNDLAVMWAVLNHQIDLSTLDISAEFRTVLGRALALKPGDRFPDAAALHNALNGTPEWISVNPRPATMIRSPAVPAPPPPDAP